MRAWAFIAATAFAVAAGAGAGSGTATTPVHYLVRPDLRMCPSPMCGGVWVRRVNHATTRCVDGASRSECYAASIVPRSAAAGDIVLGRLLLDESTGDPRLGKLVAAGVWTQTGEPARRAPVYRVVDTGVRCVTAPCFSYRATLLERDRVLRLSDVDTTRVDLPPDTRRRILPSLSRGGILAAGTVRAVPNAGPAGTGRVLVAVQVWLRAPRS